MRLRFLTGSSRRLERSGVPQPTHEEMAGGSPRLDTLGAADLDDSLALAQQLIEDGTLNRFPGSVGC